MTSVLRARFCDTRSALRACIMIQVTPQTGTVSASRYLPGVVHSWQVHQVYTWCRYVLPQDVVPRFEVLIDITHQVSRPFCEVD